MPHNYGIYLVSCFQRHWAHLCMSWLTLNHYIFSWAVKSQPLKTSRFYHFRTIAEPSSCQFYHESSVQVYEISYCLSCITSWPTLAYSNPLGHSCIPSGLSRKRGGGALSVFILRYSVDPRRIHLTPLRSSEGTFHLFKPVGPCYNSAHSITSVVTVPLPAAGLILGSTP